jgi:hypothetical protein
MNQIARLAPLLIFIALGLRIAWVVEERRRRSAINQLVVYVIAAYLAVTLAQVDAWPFSSYALMTVDRNDHSERMHAIAFRAVDVNGGEWPVDAQAWSPLSQHALMGWFSAPSTRAVPGREREDALRFLLLRAERARASRARGRRFIGNACLLGPLAAPDIYADGGPRTSDQPYVSIRVYRESWNPADVIQGRQTTSRDLLAEVRR